MHRHTRTIAAVLVGMVFSATLAYAVPPLSGYSPGQTLDPSCAPVDTDCVVAISSQWATNGGDINFNTGNVGIGTTTPSVALDVAGEIRGTNLTISGSSTTIGTPTGLTATQTCADGCNYVADGSSGSPHNYRVYAYKTVGSARIYSSSYATLSSDFTDDGSNANYDLTVSWNPVSGADGYRVLVYDPNYNGYSYDAGYDTTSTSFIDDGCGSVCFDGNSTATRVTPSVGYTNTSTFNGDLTVHGRVTVGNDLVINGSAISIAGINYIFPDYQGQTDQVLVNGGSGVMYWADLPSVPVVAITQLGQSLVSIGAGSSASTSNGIFFGGNAGSAATNASSSNFLGYYAGFQATNASYSNFFGQSAGYGATGASNSNFLGFSAGQDATSASLSNFLGNSAGRSATNASYSNFFGSSAGYAASDATNSNFFGLNAGQSATSASYSNFLGNSAGHSASNASGSNFLGRNAGSQATDAANSNFFGVNAGFQAINAPGSNFFGNSAGYSATNASYSNFFGANAGNSATSASSSNFLGNAAGGSAVNARRSIFIGEQTGNNATNAANTISLGSYAGLNDTVNNTAAYNETSTFANTSILIGHRTSTGGFSNSIALGAYAINTGANQFMIGSTQRPIDTTRINGSASTQCTITTGTGIACTSDERLKTNISDLSSDTLSKLLSVRTITYNWLQNPDSPSQIGFLAQDLEQYFPELVATDSDGYKSVYYAQMTPILTEAIRELNSKIAPLPTTTDATISERIRAFLEEVGQGIVRSKQLCTEDICVDKQQLQKMIEYINAHDTSASVPVVPSTSQQEASPSTQDVPQEEVVSEEEQQSSDTTTTVEQPETVAEPPTQTLEVVDPEI